MANQEIKNLLTFNRKTFQGLHAIVGMDFCKPFKVVEGFGNFTAKSIMKSIGNVDLSTHYVFVQYMDTRRWNKGRAFLARLDDDGKFEVQRATIFNYERFNGYRWFDTVGGKGDFEEIRKDSAGHYFIIVQEKAYEVRNERTIDLTERFRKNGVPYYRNGDNYYNSIFTRTSNIRYSNEPKKELDKSGYLLGQNNYKRRLFVIRQEKSRENAATFDRKPKYTEFTERLQKINALMIKEIQSEKPNYNKLEKATRALSWMGDKIDTFMTIEFSGMGNLEGRIKSIEDYLTDAEKALTNEV